MDGTGDAGVAAIAEELGVDKTDLWRPTASATATDPAPSTRPGAPTQENGGLAQKSMRELVDDAHIVASVLEKLASGFEGHASYLGGFDIASDAKLQEVGRAGLNGRLEDALDRLRTVWVRLDHADMWIARSVIGDQIARGAASDGPVSG